LRQYDTDLPRAATIFRAALPPNIDAAPRRLPRAIFAAYYMLFSPRRRHAVYARRRARYKICQRRRFARFTPPPLLMLARADVVFT